MAGSTISLDSLSSPSPSLSPPPESNKHAEPTSAGLNSDSELSELTEEEQEADKRNHAPRKGARNGISHRGGRPSRRGGRRKTSSIVPAPMWGWAETKSSSNVVEEEEEEEMGGPPRAMEEEEDEEGGRDDEQEEEEEEPEEEPEAKQVGIVPEEDDLPAVEADEDESFSGDDDPTYCSRRSTRKSNPSCDANMNGSLKNGDDMDVDADDDVDEASDAEALPIQMNEPESEDENGNHSETEDEGDDDKDALPAPDADEPTTTTTISVEIDLDVNAETLQAQDLAPLAAAAAASSIMAGSGVIDPPSPSSSQRSTPASSRSNSPAPGTDAEDAADANPGEEKDEDDATLLSAAADVDAAEQEGAEENDLEVDDGDIDDTNLEDDVDNDVESDLQPAHRAEALDVLAAIELKFALLRERVYVEKMENLAWEEALVNEGTHPELLHLQRELSTRRDKRIELATRKRLLEVANVNKRRRTDEDGIWSWWKFSRDDLQTEMIAETNRKRRRMERERRVNDRHQPGRAIPPVNQEYPPAQRLRKVVKSIAFSNMRTKSYKRCRPPRLVYPELSSLSDYDIAYDMECIFQAQRERSRVNIPLGGYDISHVHRVPSASVYQSNGPYMKGASHVGYSPLPPSHQVGYNDGGHINGSRPYPNGVSNIDHRIPPFSQGLPPQHVHHHLPPPPPQHMMPHSHPHTSFAGPPGSRNIHMQQPQHPPPAPLHSGHGHHSQAPPPHNVAPPFNIADQDIPVHSHHTHNHALPHAHGSSYYPPRRSPSPAGIGMMQNGGSSSSKMGPGLNGVSSWMGSGMGMEHVYTGSGPAVGKGADWGRDRERDGRAGPEEDERERMSREMDKRERDQRERDIQRERERERDEMERERQRDIHHLHHQPPQQPPQQHQQITHRHQAPQHLHLHPGPGSQSHHHISGPHHHHRPHHHHVVHHHHQLSSVAHSGHPNSLSQGLRSPRNLQRDRNEREREHDNRPSHNQHPTEVINLTSSKPPTSSQFHDQHPPTDYRDVRSKHGSGGSRTPSSSGPGSSMVIDDKERPPSMPFALPPSHGLPLPNHGPPGSNSLNGRMTPPRNSWNISEDNNYRGPLLHPSSGPPPGPYHGVSHESGTPHTRSPNQAHRYTNNASSLARVPPPPSGPPSSQQSSRHNSIGLHSPPRPALPRPPVPPAPASPALSTSAPAPYPSSNTNPNRSPSRFADPRSPPINFKMRPPSPPPNKMSSYAVLSGPGGTLTPTLEKNNSGPSGPGYSGSRGPEAMIPFQSSSRGYVGQNGTNDRDRDKERERERDRPPLSHFGPPPPPPAPSKMSVPQMVDGH